jgi:DNA-binding response OmpR family regulator
VILATNMGKTANRAWSGHPYPPCILVVTDEPLIRHMVARLLASEGLWAVTAERGESDFEGFARIPLALILVNTYLPDLSGAEVVARVSAARTDGISQALPQH